MGGWQPFWDNGAERFWATGKELSLATGNISLPLISEFVGGFGWWWWWWCSLKSISSSGSGHVIDVGLLLPKFWNPQTIKYMKMTPTIVYGSICAGTQQLCPGFVRAVMYVLAIETFYSKRTNVNGSIDRYTFILFTGSEEDYDFLQPVLHMW